MSNETGLLSVQKADSKPVCVWGPEEYAQNSWTFLGIVTICFCLYLFDTICIRKHPDIPMGIL